MQGESKMKERDRSQTTTLVPGNGLGDVFAAEPAGGEMATVTHGLFTERLPVSGMRIADVRRQFATRLDIDPQSVATLDATPVDEDAIVGTGQMLEFIRAAGEKG
jgi:hypothetical protein